MGLKINVAIDLHSIDNFQSKGVVDIKKNKKAFENLKK